jgi:hypothetical protein
MHQQLEHGISSPHFASAVSSDGRISPLLKSSSSEAEALAHPLTHLPSTASAPLIPQAPVSSTAAPGLRKYHVLLLGLLVLPIAVAVGTDLVNLSRAPSTISSTQRNAPISTPTVVASATPTSGASIYPSLAASYAGTAADLMTAEHTSLFLRNIRQSQGNIQGSF